MSTSAKGFALVLILISQLFSTTRAASPPKPNIIVIVADDLGWPDLGIMGATDFPTPHIDSLATNGVRFMNGYVSAPICSPSRAGLITGRYQQRFGHEINPGPQLERNPIFGVPVTQAIIGNRMKDLGYATAWIGKSHLGGAPEYHPLQRGFDQFFGFIEGHHNYKYPYDDAHDPIMAGTTATGPTNTFETNYLTTAFQRECVDFIRAHTNQSFFLYAPFNAIHFPLQAETNHLEGIDSTNYTSLPRYIAAAMIQALDTAVGDILTNLTQLNLLTNTLIIFTSDNGAPAPGGIDRNGSVNFPLKGYKGALYEGGVRVPFLVQWTGQIPPRTDSNTVVSALDIVPTSIAAAGGTIQPAWKLDGQNLLPFLKQQSAPPTRDLFWRMETMGGDGIPPGPCAVRSGDWKMVKPSRDAHWELYNLIADQSEATNLASAHPDIVHELIERWEDWDDENARPLWDFNTTNYVMPDFIREDIRIGATNISYFVPEFLPNTDIVAFQNGLGEIWLGYVDGNGLFHSGHGQDQRIDSRLGSSDRLSWGISSDGPSLFYSKGNIGVRPQLWRARAANDFSPVQVTPSLSYGSISPRATQNRNDLRILINYTCDTTTTDTNVWISDIAPTQPRPLVRALPSTINSFWISNSRQLVYAGYPTAQSTVSQLIRLDTDTGITNLVTTGADNKTDPRPFLAAELNGELLYAAISSRTNLSFYRALGNGTYSNIVSLAFPAAASMPYIFSLEPLRTTNGFNGVSYFCFAAYQNNNLADPGDSSIWLVALGPNEDQHLVRRLDNDPLDPEVPAHPGRRDPKFFTGIAQNEIFVFYSQYETNTVQLRRARTGIKLPEFNHRGQPSGFTSLAFSRSHTAGTNDPAGRYMNSTETTILVPHNGWLFAGQGSRNFLTNNPTSLPTNWSGAQILIKTSNIAPWKVDYTSGFDPFPIHLRVESLKSLQLSAPAGQLTNILIAGMSDITSTGAVQASTRLRTPDGVWEHAHVTTAPEEAYPISFASHRVGDLRILFTGLSNGQIHFGAFNPAIGNIVWNTSPDLRLANSAIAGLAEANGYLYAAAGLIQSNVASQIQGGLYARNDSNSEWTLVHRPPFPTNVFSRPRESMLLRGLTTVPAPNGAGHEVLLLARWPGVIERIDPTLNHLANIEIDLRAFFARTGLFTDEAVRNATFTAGYTEFTPATNLLTGELTHLIGVWFNTGASTPESYFLIRHTDATYELAVIPNPIAATELRATRAIAASPFPNDPTIYFAGYDTANEESHTTAWINAGAWRLWPALTLTRSNPPFWQLSWPATSTDWLLETTPTLPTGWQPTAEFTTRSTTENTLEISTQTPNSFYRLRHP